MAARTTDFGSGSAASWPALSNGDTWAAAVVPDSAIDVYMYSSISEDVNSSGYGKLHFNLNAVPTFRHIWGASGTPFTYSTTSNASSYLVPSASIGLGINTNYLLFFSTTAASSHTHVIDTATSSGIWASSTYTTVGTNEWTIGGSSADSFCRQSIYHVKGPSSAGAIGKLNILIKNSAGTASVTAQGRDFYIVEVTGAIDGSTAYTNFTSNSDTDGTYNTQPSVVLINNLATRSSSTIGFFTHLTNDVSASSSNAYLINDLPPNNNYPTTSGHITPNFASAVLYGTGGTTSATRKTTKTLTANFTTSTTAWGAAGCEVKDAETTNDTWDASSYVDYYVHKLANTTTYSSSTIYLGLSGITSATNSGLVGRYVTYGSNNYWITANYNVAAGSAGNTIGIDIQLNKLASGVKTVSALTSPAVAVNATFANLALRIREMSSTSLWISAKLWNGSEPSWPAATNTANSSSTTAGSEYVIGNILSSDADIANLILGGAGKNGIFTGETSNILTFTSFSDNVITESGTSSISGGGVVSSTATRIVKGLSSISGGGSIASNAKRISVQSLISSISQTSNIKFNLSIIKISSINSISSIFNLLNKTLLSTNIPIGVNIKNSNNRLLSNISSNGNNINPLISKIYNSNINSSSGARKKSYKTHAGLVESVAHIHKRNNKILYSNLVTSASVNKLSTKKFLASVASSGSFTYEYISGLITLLLSGSVSSGSVIKKRPNKRHSGLVGTEAETIFVASRRLVSIASSGGLISKTIGIRKSGLIASASIVSISRLYRRLLSSSISTMGILRKRSSRRLVSSIASSSTARKRPARRLHGLISTMASVISLSSAADMAISGTIEINTIIDINMIYEDASIILSIDGI